MKQLIEEAAERAAARAVAQMQNNQPIAWVRKEEAMDMLGVSYSTLNRIVNQGMIRKGGVGKSPYYNVQDLEAYLAGRPNFYKPEVNQQ